MIDCPPRYTAFAGPRMILQGRLADVAIAVKAELAKGSPDAILTFDDASGRVIDLDLRGDDAEIIKRMKQHEPVSPTPRGRGRPRLGVTAREVTLLPRQWEWLAAQPGGASQALRRLVDQARRADGGQSEARAARDRAYRFLSVIAGDMPGFEDAARALFAGDLALFAARIAPWPADIGRHALALARPEPAP